MSALIVFEILIIFYYLHLFYLHFFLVFKCGLNLFSKGHVVRYRYLWTLYSDRSDPILLAGTELHSVGSGFVQLKTFGQSHRVGSDGYDRIFPVLGKDTVTPLLSSVPGRNWLLFVVTNKHFVTW